MIKKRFQILISTWLVMVCAVGCASTQKVSAPAPNTVASVWLNQLAGIEVEEAYRHEGKIYVRYNAFSNDVDSEKVFCAKRGEGEDPGYLEYFSPSEWEPTPLEAEELLILDVYQTKEFRAQLVQGIAPQESGMGVVVRSNEEELFMFYDENHELKAVDLKEKPAGMRIQEILNKEQFSAKIVSSLQAFLQENNLRGEKVLLTLFYEDEAAYPFLFVDVTAPEVLCLEIEPQGERYQGNMLKKSVKSANSLIVNGHLLGLATRPVSSTYRLYQWSKGTVYDIVSPQKLGRRQSKEIPPLYEGEGMDLDAWEKRLDELVGKNASKGTITFLIDGDQFFPRLIDSFQRAEESISVRIFIFDNDDYAVKIADLLKKRSNEDVQVKVLLDSLGQVMGEEAFPDSLPPGFVPPYSMQKYLTKDSAVAVRTRPDTWFKSDHIKTITIDNKVCYTGGMNIGREYRYHWHDMMMRLQGPVVRHIIKDFNLAWDHSGRLGDLGYLTNVLTSSKVKEGGEGYPVRLLYTRANDPQIFRAQIEAIRSAKKYIYVNNAYFSDNAILYELIRARQRGVDVRVILPVSGNHGIMNMSNIVTANVLFRNGIRVFFYPGMSHIKAAIYDGWLCTGTANFDKLSFRDNLEMNVATSAAEPSEDLLERLFQKDFKKSKEMTQLLETSVKDFLAEFLAEQL